MNLSSLAECSTQWFSIMQSTGMHLLLIPAVLLTTATLLVDALLLVCVFSSASLRQETRYLLLASTLLSDILFLVLNLINLSFNAAGLEQHFMLCQFIMFSTVMTFCTSELTVTLMVLDTFVAVRWPLRYYKILPLPRVQKIIGIVWALAALYPLVLLVAMEVAKEGVHEKMKVCVVLLSLGHFGGYVEVALHVYFAVWMILCLVLIVYCYVRLYAVTKHSGIWSSRFSRARRTLLVHALMLALYFVPCLVFMVELAEFFQISNEVHVRLNTVNLTVLMLLPRACAPYLYGLRYRKIYDAVRQTVWRTRLSRDTRTRQVQAS